MKELIIPSVSYLSDADETSFFNWLQSIPGVVEVVGCGRELVVTLSPPLTDEAVRELLALHHRYEVLSPSLLQLKTQENCEWFSEPEKYWHSAVFGP